jgi:light-regulated signal transduction histidine kinase (bacteriophytochrome)/CheY-like chemotaxis protein
MQPATDDSDPHGEPTLLPTGVTSDAPGVGRVDLDNCDREPIHIPGSVQPHGVLLALRKPDLVIVQVSGNAGQRLGISAGELVGEPLDRVLAPADQEPLRRALADGTLTAQPFYLLTIHAPPGGPAFDAIAHRHDGLVILELEPAGRHEAYTAPQLYQAAQGALRRVEAAESLQAMGEVVAEEVRRLSGFDRVMVYRFDADYNGTVVAEAKRHDLEPFLGLHYPASDIPAQARDLYLRNRLRFIPDRDYVPSPLVPDIDPLTGRPLDMSYAVLRSVSPIHCEYLRNMGVRASMSISLRKNGRLWGLIACHHYAGPRYVTHDVRTACELIGDVMGVQLTAKADVEMAAYAANMDAVRWALARRTEEAADIASALTGFSPGLLDLVQAGGAAVVQDGRVMTVGRTPADRDLVGLARWLAAREVSADRAAAPEAFHTASIAEQHDPSDRLTPTAAGVLAVSLIRGRPHYVMWFRPEQVRTVNWAGDPAKSVVKGDAGVRLSPRGSFALWSQIVRGTAEPWTAAEVRAALSLQRDVVGLTLRRGETLAKLYEELRASYTQLGSAASLLAQSEERLRLATEAGGVGIWDWDVTTGRVALSAEYYRMVGLEPGQFGETFAAFMAAVHPDDRGRVQAALDAARLGRTEFAAEYRLCCPPFADRWVAGRGRFAYSEAGLPVRLVAVAVDVTEAKLADAERRELLDSERAARGEAERASRLKDEFLATLSHELRTPLNAIIGWSVLLRGADVDNADLAEGMDAIERNARVQAQLVEDLLDVSRIIAGKVRLDVQHVELAPVVEASVAALAPAAHNKQVRLQKVIDPRASAVWGDPARLQQVIWNLLSNAIKFTPKGGRVQVSVALVGSHVELGVTDSGMGIAPEFLPHVFDRFRQADATTTRRFGGLGLGLAIVRHLVELHGGTVEARSGGPGTGATFTVRLPLKAMDRSADGPDGRGRRIAPSFGECPSPSLAGLRALVVDDEPDARYLVRRILEQCDVVVTTAASVPEALAAVAAGRFDVIVSDIGMPEQDGFDLIRRVRALPADAGGRTPAVALTALARLEDRRRALLMGFQIHVPKPVDPAELLAVVASVAGRTG